jgi:hypothetical protein
MNGLLWLKLIKKQQNKPNANLEKQLFFNQFGRLTRKKLGKQFVKFIQKHAQTQKRFLKIVVNATYYNLWDLLQLIL